MSRHDPRQNRRSRLSADVRMQIPFPSREPSGEVYECPRITAREDHGRHWYEVPGRSGRTLCTGWHAMTRDITVVPARWHADYVRGKNSDVIHRSSHEGEITWFPVDFHEPSSHRIALWEIGIRCVDLWLRNAEPLTANQVWAARPRKKDGGPIRLCPKCFPGAGNLHIYASPNQ